MKRLWFTIAMVAVVLVLLEVLARMWSPPSINVDVGTQMHPNAQRIWSLEPSSQSTQFGALVTVDALGMRKPAGSSSAERWLILGDSSFFGHGLADQDTLHAQLSTLWAENGRDVYGQCGAVPGYSIIQTKLWMDELGWSLKPDVLVIGNLWSDNNFDHFQDREWLNSLQHPATKMLRVLTRSQMFLWLANQLRPPTLERGSPHGKISWLRDPTATGLRRVELSDYSETLGRLIEEASKREVGVILVQPANRYRVEGLAGEATWDPYFSVQSALGKHHQVLTVDAAAALSAFAIPAEQAFIDELHPSALANRWIAQAIISAVQGRTESLIPSVTESWEGVTNDPWATQAPFEANIGR